MARRHQLSQAGQILQAALQSKAKAGKLKRLPKFPKPKDIKQLERKYQKTLRAIVARLSTLIGSRLVHRLQPISTSFYASHPSIMKARHDVDETLEITKIIDDIRIEMGREYTPDEVRAIARNQGVSISDYNEKVIEDGLRRVVGVDVFMSEPWLSTQLDAFAAVNVDLIQGLTDYALDKVKSEVMTGLMNGVRWEEIAQNIQDIVSPDSPTSRRADFIARDQVSKLNGQLTGLRQSDLGIEKFIWRTSLDERVRDSHREKEGHIYEWADPPADTGAPGEDYNCRCTAEPYLQETLGDAFASTGPVVEDDE